MTERSGVEWLIESSREKLLLNRGVKELEQEGKKSTPVLRQDWSGLLSKLSGEYLSDEEDLFSSSCFRSHNRNHSRSHNRNHSRNHDRFR